MAKIKSFVGRPRKISKEAAKHSQLATYQRIAAMEKKILEQLTKLAFESESEKTRYDANTYLMDKLLPNKKAEGLANDKAGFTINIAGGGFVPPTESPLASMGSNTRPTPIQSFSLAQKSQENVNSNNRSRPTGSA